ncbi:hypothetical protein B5C34_06470 [Pacificimonas flava]|uniref:Insertion element IS402-like domain-containing protein n=2 Tax=Pacificimonas TaxID=1960290 RepID=A0A219B467_9SPHN|nr:MULTISPECIES: transposase [Pacificimonas]MBZ6377129.1 transposase [Pacificimonas aurantium]OWV33145.1 hypothetical protein B5C34_06470 [Pacificimonas flava]
MEVHRIGGNERKIAWVTRAEAARLSCIFRDAISPWSLKSVYGIAPLQAAQLAASGLIDRCQSPEVSFVSGAGFYSRQSIDDFIEELSPAVERIEETSGWIKLDTALQMVGGRPKPWAALLQRVLESRFYYLGTTSGTLRLDGLYLRRSESWHIKRMNSDGKWDLADELPDGFMIGDLDAMGYLNCTPNAFYDHVKPALRARRDTENFGIRDVHAFAQTYASTKEISAYYGLPCREISAELKRAGYKPRFGGSFWRRGDAFGTLFRDLDVLTDTPSLFRQRTGTGVRPLSDGEFAKLSNLIPCCRTSRRCLNDRSLINGIIWKASTKKAWSSMPPELGNVSEMKRGFEHLRDNGGLTRIARALAGDSR